MVNIKLALAFGLLATASAASIHQDRQDKRHIGHAHAHGKDKHHAHHHRRNKKTCSASSVLPAKNMTETATGPAAATTVGSSSAAPSVVTVSVIPVPIPASSSGPAAVPSSGPSSPAGVAPSSPAGSSSQAGAVPSSPAAAPSGGAGTSPAAGSCGLATSYVTVQQTITVTAGQNTTTYSAAATTMSTSTVTLTSTSTSVSTVVVSSSSSSAPAAVTTSSSVPPPAVSTSTSSAPPPPPPASSSSTTPVAAAPSSPAAIAPSAPGMLQTGTTTTSAAPAPATSPASSSGGSYTGGKWGTSWIPGVGFDTLGLGGMMPWVYDWGQVGSGIPDGVEYVPTLHDGDKCAGFAAQVQSQPNVKYLKHFNEPDNYGGGGCNLTPGAAASLHNQYIAPLMDSYTVGFPAVTSNNIPGTSGTGWLQAFAQEVGCKGFGFADFHFYYTSGNDPISTQVSVFLSFVDNWISTVDSICPNMNLPIWISEFSASNTGDVAQAAEFMALAGPALMTNARVQRFSYFMPSNNDVSNAINAIKAVI